MLINNLNEDSNMKKRTSTYIAISIMVLALIAIGVAVYGINNKPSKISQSQQAVLGTTNSKEITYSGKDGITALVLLQQKYKAEISGTGASAFVTSINGLAANPKNEFWAFNINGKPATVGAGNYITKVDDTITWKLSSF